MKKIQVSQQFRKKLQTLILDKKATNEDKCSPTTNSPMPVVSSCPEYKGERKLIEWVDGVPVPKTERVLNEGNVVDILKAASSLPFTEEDDFLGIYPELYGMSYMEVATIQLARQAARGDQKAIDMLLDRNIGKPKQTNENRNMNMTYQDFLDNITKQTQPVSPNLPPGEVFDVG